MSATELARRTGIKQSTMSRRMTGETAFDMDDLEVIADALGVEVADLMPKSARAGGGDFKDLYLPASFSDGPVSRSADVDRVAPRSASPFGQPARRDPSRPRGRDRVKGRRPPHQRPTVLPM